MLFATPTSKGTGLTIYGDFLELDFLYETIHHIAKPLDNVEHFHGQFQTLMNFAYEVRKANTGCREIKKIQNNYDNSAEQVTCYGYKVVWTDILIFINVLRSYAGYSPLTKSHQAVLYSLENVIEQAMLKYDEKGAKLLNRALNNGLNVSDKYLFVLYQAIHIDFVMQTPGKRRFRRIMETMSDYLYSYSAKHTELINSIEKQAKQNNSNPLNFEYQEFPDIEW